MSAPYAIAALAPDGSVEIAPVSAMQRQTTAAYADMAEAVWRLVREVMGLPASKRGS